MLTFPAHENVSSLHGFHLFPSSFPSSWNLSVSLALVLSLVMMLTGSNAFRGLEGERLRVILENGKPALRSVERKILLRSSSFSTVYFFLSHICVERISQLVYSLSAVRFCGVQHPGGSCRFLFSFLFFLSSRHSPFLSFFSSCYLAVWESSQDFTSVGWVWTPWGR